MRSKEPGQDRSLLCYMDDYDTSGLSDDNLEDSLPTSALNKLGIPCHGMNPEMFLENLIEVQQFVFLGQQTPPTDFNELGDLSAEHKEGFMKNIFSSLPVQASPPCELCGTWNVPAPSLKPRCACHNAFLLELSIRRKNKLVQVVPGNASSPKQHPPYKSTALSFPKRPRI